MSTLKVKNGDGDNRFLGAVGDGGTAADPFYTINGNFLVAVKAGNVAGHSVVHKFGHNDSVPNGTFEFVTVLGQTAHALSALTTVRIKAGGAAADDAAGAGAQEITIQGIDSTLAEVTETIATNGIAASAVTTKTWWRVHRVWVSAVGTYGAANSAAITIENGTGGTDILVMGAGDGQSNDAVYTIPTGKTGHLLSVHVTVDSSQDATVNIFTRDNITDVVAPMSSKRMKKHFDGLDSTFRYAPLSPNTSISALSDIWAEASGGGGSTKVSIDLEILLIDN